MRRNIWVLLLTICFCECKSQDLLPFQDGSLWGFKDKEGTVIIPPQFQYALRFKYGIGVVAKNDSLGAIDNNNNTLIPFQYQFLDPLDSTEFLFGFRTKYFGEYRMGVLASNGAIKIPAAYSFINKRYGRYMVVRHEETIIHKSPSGDTRSIKSFYGLFDQNGKEVIPCKYDYLDWVNEGLLILTKGNETSHQALFNSQGKQLTGFEYMVFGKLIEGVMKARIDNKFGFVYPTGQVAIPIQFDYCEDFSKGYAMIKQKDTWGAINKKGDAVIEPVFSQKEVEKKLKEKYGR